MNYNKTIGRYGETIAADYLINNGYEYQIEIFKQGMVKQILLGKRMT